jgi:hypothetical protein
MTAHYEELIELWKAGKFFDAIRYFCHWILEGLESEGESKSFNKDLAKFWELVEVECEENVEFMFNLYEMLKRLRDWDDERLCKEIRISDEAIEDIKKRHKPRSEAVGLKMLYELFPHMAV